jgi:shikimate dehydrogenase
VKRFGLIGYPLSHSFSKKFFTEKFEREAIKDCAYDNFSISTIEQLPELLEENPDLQGLNITIPYKEKVIPFLSDSNDVVKQTGACNCIRIKEGKLYGFNTDVTGFQHSFETKLLPGHKKALILGKGGAAKAVAYVLGTLGIDYLFVVRRQDDTADTVLYDDVDKLMVQSHPIIVNTTPLGTFPDTAAAPPLPYEFISAGHYLYDLVYNPDKTLFLKLGEDRGATIQNGSGMLVIQAEESWKIWTQ